MRYAVLLRGIKNRGSPPFKIKEMKKHKKRLTVGLAVVAVIMIMGGYLLLSPFSRSEKKYIYVKKGDSYETLCQRLDSVAGTGKMLTFKLLGGALALADNLHEGKYNLQGVGTLRLVRNLRNGHQATVAFTVPPVNLPENLAARLGKTLATDSAMFARAFADKALLKKYGMTPSTLFCYVLPDTYDLYWNISPEAFLSRMKKESEKFWTAKRKAQAEEAGLTTEQVVTLASIVEKESLDKGEKRIIAGLYLNRLKKDMKLQACPTAIYVNRVFGVHRVIDEYLRKDDPYNTYIYKGLPPGPICIPTKETLEAVLDFDHNDYLYMCAKEDFSGRHNFAATGEEHMQNARRYAKALNERKIMK